MSILGTCPECKHHNDGMCDLRPRICFNYDCFERRPMVTLTQADFETLYISRATYDAQVAALQTALAEANEDAERLAEESAFYEEGTGWRCIHCGENTKRNGYAIKHASDCPITLHRARVGGAS